MGERGVFTAGVQGSAGQAGYQGPQGGIGPIGDQGVVGIVERWTTYQEFNFNGAGENIMASETDRISEIAAYLVRNPSLEVGIDGSMDNRGFNQRDRDQSSRRADAVRAALMQAGVPAYKIQMGAFADPARRQQGQIQVLVKTRA